MIDRVVMEINPATELLCANQYKRCRRCILHSLNSREILASCDLYRHELEIVDDSNLIIERLADCISSSRWMRDV